ncbi:MAG: cbb3-type cytochrome c oxidase N-terminal domain-containing protein [Planctomycetota bacterium]
MSTINPNNPTDLPGDEPPIMGDHTYDGIQEYDNPIPGWWKWLFIATIVFTPIYIMWFHAPGQERDLIGQYNRAYAANLERKFGDMPDLAADPAEDVLRYMNDEEWLAVGVATFASNCASCHGAEGQGGSGPNLTDEYYKNVKTAADLVEVLNNGAAGGAMPAWGNRLHPNAIVLTAAYVAQMRGQNLPGNPPEGDVIPAWGP